MLESLRERAVWFAVCENFRFQLACMKVAEVLAEGAIGEPSWARIRFRTGVDVYRNQPYSATRNGSPFSTSASTCLTSRGFFLGEVVRVSCETQRRNPTVRAEDTATVLLRHAEGAVSVVECTYESRQPSEGQPEVLLTIEGPRGAIVAPPGGREVLVTVGEETIRHRVAEDGDDVSQRSVHATCAHLLAALRAGREADTSGADNIRIYALAEAAYAAAASGHAVEPSE